MDTATRHERKRILRQIDLLEIGRCSKCKDTPSTQKMVHCDCSAAVEIRTLGEQLLVLSGNREDKAIKELAADIKANGLTVEKYNRLKEHRLNDKQIIKLIGWYMGRLYNFKYDEGISKRKGPQQVKLTEKQKQTALSNNIPLSLARTRISIQGWSIKRAITEPKNARLQELGKWIKVANSNGISKSVFMNRIKRDETPEEASSRPENAHKASKFTPEMVKVAEENGIGYFTFRKRVLKLGWSQERAATEQPRKSVAR